MAPKLASALAIASCFCLALATSAPATTGVAGLRALGDPAPERAERSAAASSLIAPSAACPVPEPDSPAPAQEEAMLCLTDFARVHAGLGDLVEAEALDLSSQGKAEDVLRCDSFSHFACGREFTYWIRASGYTGEGCWHAGENLAWGTGEYGSVRSIFRAWMNSPTHRKNLLGDYSEVGFSLATGELEGRAGTHVWAAHFGARCAG